MSGWQLSGDAPTFYTRYAYACCGAVDGRLDIAGSLQGRRSGSRCCLRPRPALGKSIEFAKAACNITGIDINEACSMPRERSRI